MTGETEKQQWVQGWVPIIKSAGDDDVELAVEEKMKCATRAWNQRGNVRRIDWTAILWYLCRIVSLRFGLSQARTSSQFQGSNLM
jgi:hypothetical protein